MAYMDDVPHGILVEKSLGKQLAASSILEAILWPVSGPEDDSVIQDRLTIDDRDRIHVLRIGDAAMLRYMTDNTAVEFVLVDFHDLTDALIKIVDETVVETPFRNSESGWMFAKRPNCGRWQSEIPREASVYD
ncbi:hypothetical protein [Natrinema salifodinae]|uniref:hypothetical protein n=1 Tax=Natrinema salifodinae TaxID=1202768 RepID=UPI001160A66E|nr:hypothetical protein [Natrinema salifodinae]